MKKLIVFVFSVAFALCLGGCTKEATSIGVIGGADGPTAIFLTSNVSWLSVCVFIGILVVAVLLALIIYRKNKKKK